MRGVQLGVVKLHALFTNSSLIPVVIFNFQYTIILAQVKLKVKCFFEIVLFCFI